MFIKLYFIALPVFIAMDLVWLALIAKSFYQKEIGFLLKPEVNWYAAIIFYFIFILGLVFFVIAPGVEKGSITHVILFGALFGLVTYATYDLTNLAVTKDWTVLVTIIDIAWGVVIATSVSLVTYIIASKF